MPERRKRAKKGIPPSPYVTMPHYFPTEQVDIVRKLRSKRRIKRK